MSELHLSIGEPFTSPAWGSNFVVFSDSKMVEEQDSKDYLRRVCKYARHHGVYLVPGRFHLMGYRCMCLISPEGRVLGAQKGVYWHTATRVGNHSSELEVFSTEFGGVLLCPDVDIFHPEIPRIAESMGAQYIVCAQEIPDEDYNTNMVLTGPWNAAQACNLFAIAVCNQYHCVCAPLEITRQEDGFLLPPTRHTPATAKLDATALRAIQRPFRLNRKFYAFHRGDLLR